MIYALEHSTVDSVLSVMDMYKSAGQTHVHMQRQFGLKYIFKQQYGTSQKETYDDGELNCMDNRCGVLRAEGVLCPEEVFLSVMSLSCILQGEGIWRDKKRREGIHEQKQRGESENLLVERKMCLALVKGLQERELK